MTTWSANWIWLDAELPEVNTYGIFRKTFTLDRVPDGAEALITCDSRYQLYVNGRYLGRGVAPNHPDQPFHDTWRITSLLKPGENCVAVLVYYRGIDTFNYLAGKPGLRLQIMDRETPLLVTDETWKATPADMWTFGPLPRISPQQGFIEIYDARKEPIGWTSLDFDDSSWSAARVVEGPKTVLERPTPNTLEAEMLPVKVVQRGVLRPGPAFPDNPAAAMMADETRPAPYDLLAVAQSLCKSAPEPLEVGPSTQDKGTYLIFDMGRECTGTIRLEIEAPAGIEIDIGHGEHLDDGRVRALIGRRHFADRYITREGLQSFDVSFRRVGCRYIQLNVRHGAEKCVLRRVSLLEDVYPFPERGSFACSDSLLNEVWQVAAHSLRCCVHETYEDCPWREQSQYAGDSRLQILAGYRVFGETAMPRKALVQLATFDTNGFQHLTYPGSAHVFIPGFNLIWVCTVLEYYQQTGEVELVKELFPAVKRLLDEFSRFARPDGLLDDLKKRVPKAWQFIDWAGLSQEGVVAAQNLLYLEALRAASEMAAVIGRKADSAAFKQLADRVAAAIVEVFRMPGESFRLADNLLESGLNNRVSQHVHSLALLLDLVPYGMRHKMADAMLKDHAMAQATLYFKYYLFASLLKLDRRYLKPVLEIVRKSWGGMLRRGATTFWEREDGGDAFGYAGSLCHAWSAHPAYFFSSEILGVKNVTPGGAELIIFPNPGDLWWARGVVPFPKGDVVVAWERGPRGFHIEATIPEGCQAKILAPIPLESCLEIELDTGETWHPEERIEPPFISEQGVIGIIAGPGRVRFRGLSGSWKWPGERKH